VLTGERRPHDLDDLENGNLQREKRLARRIG